MKVNRETVLLLPNREITARISYHENNADGDARGETLQKRFRRMGEKMARKYEEMRLIQKNHNQTIMIMTHNISMQTESTCVLHRYVLNLVYSMCE